MSPGAADRDVLAVVVNYQGQDHTTRAVESLLAGPVRVVVVDNDGADGVAEALAGRPGVDVVSPGSNIGFAAAANLGMARRRPGEWVALLNHDAWGAPGWLDPLVAAMERDPALGAVNPKVLLDGDFVRVDVEVPATKAGPLDRRELGLAVRSVEVDGQDRTAATRLPGFWEPTVLDGAPARWGPPTCHLWVPAGPGASVTLHLAAPRAVTATLRTAAGPVTVELDRHPRPVRLDPGEQRHAVRNSAGAELLPDWRGGDVGIDTPDTADDDRPDGVVEREVWTGAAVLLRDRYLDDVGGFDERYFLYYEDIELALRGWRRGWRYGYVPASVVHHALSSAAVVGSSFQRRHGERNRLLTVARHAPAAAVLRVLLRYGLVTASYLRRDVLGRVLARRRPDPAAVADRLAALGAFVRLVPGTLRHRLADHRR